MNSNAFTSIDDLPLSHSAMALPHRRDLTSLFFSVWTCATIAFFWLVLDEEIRHWFIVPVTMCGMLIGIDAAAWFRGEVDLFNPVGVMGLLGAHLFFLAPLLHVTWNYWMYCPGAPADWRDWLGGMAILNFFGIAIYRWSCGFIKNCTRNAPPRPVWKLSKTRLQWLLGLALSITAAAQFYVYLKFGGISGYIDAYMTTPEAFEGMGWQLMISESFPILAAVGFAIYARHRQWRMGNFSVALFLLVFCIVQFLFGGLRGSRSNTIWALFWATGIIHFWLRPMGKRLLYAGMAALVMFVYVYGFFKETGIKNLDVQQSIELGQKRGRTLDAMILGDFGRADIQAFLLYRLMSPSSDYEYAWGRTYAGAIALSIPKAIWPDRPATSVKAGTDAQHYMGAYTPKLMESSKVYGLAGETLLNFGPFAVPFSFIIFGLCVGWVHRLLIHLQPLDSRLLVMPFLVNLCFPVLIGDSDNIIFFILKQGFVPLSVIFLSSLRIPAEVEA